MWTVTGISVPDEIGGGIEALRCVAKAKTDAQRPVGKGALHLTVDGGEVAVRQLRQLIARRVGTEGTCAHQHAHIQGQGRQRAKIPRQ